MSLKLEHSRKKNKLENWRDYGGSLDRFDRNDWRKRGLYEDLSNATKCGISQVSCVLFECLQVLNCCSLNKMQLAELCLLEMAQDCSSYFARYFSQLYD